MAVFPLKPSYLYYHIFETAGRVCVCVYHWLCRQNETVHKSGFYELYFLRVFIEPMCLVQA